MTNVYENGFSSKSWRAEQSVRVSISEEGYETYRNSVQAKQQAPTYDRLIEQRCKRQYERAYRQAFLEAVRKADPNWQIGDPIKQGVLDSITRENVEKGLQISGSKLAKSSINYTIWGQI